MNLDKYIIDKEIVYELFTDDLFHGYAPVVPPVPKMGAWLSYQGPKLPIPMPGKSPQGLSWKEILAFFAWSYAESKSETQVRLYLNKETKTWRAWAFPQEYGGGMTTTELEAEGEEESQRVGLTKGWIEGGTVHHHCSSTAFQSNVDSHDEASGRTGNGIHITVGNMDKAAFSIHGRLSFRGVFYDVHWPSWFQMPSGLEGLPSHFENKVMEYFLTSPPDKDHPFPDDWKLNLIKKPPVTPALNAGHWHQHPRTGQWVNGPVEPQLSKKERKRIAREAMRDTKKETSPSELEKLTKAAKDIIMLCASCKIPISYLAKAMWVDDKHLLEHEIQAVAEADDILEKAGNLTFEEVEDWIETCNLCGEPIA